MALIFLCETTLVLGAAQQYLKANKTQAFCKTKSTILVYLLVVPTRYRLPSVLRMLILSSLATEGRSRLHDSALQVLPKRGFTRAHNQTNSQILRT